MLYQRKYSLPGGLREASTQKPKALSPSATAVDIIFEEDSQQQQQPAPKLSIEMRRNGYKRNGQAVKKWVSAFRVVSAMTRLKNLPKRHHPPYDMGIRSRGSSVSGDSNESTPTRTYAEGDSIDPVYLALKQATTKYGPSNGNSNNGSRGGSRRSSSQNAVGGPVFELSSQTSLQDSGTYSENEHGGNIGIGTTSSTPQLSGAPTSVLPTSRQDIIANGGSNTNLGTANGAAPANNFRRPKLSEMKSLSLDCADMPPPPVQNGMRQQYYKAKMPRSARAGESLDQHRASASPTSSRAMLSRQRRLPPVPVVAQQNAAAEEDKSQLLHIVTHDYVSGECSLRPGDRLVIVDNGDPDWKHGFKMNDRLEQLLTFPNSCVAAYKVDEQPMRLTQSCNLVEQKLRLYRDQVVFAQPNSLSEDGRVLIRNEHDKFAKCPLQFLSLA